MDAPNKPTPARPPCSNELFVVVYDELRRLAAARLSADPVGASLRPTSLVHQAYLRIIGDAAAENTAWNDREHFFRAAALSMRRIIIDRARERSQLKRGGDLRRVTLDENIDALGTEGDAGLNLLDLDDALTAFEREDPRRYQVVMLRFFAGLSVEQTAELLGVSEPTIKRDWTYARAWLLRRMTTR